MFWILIVETIGCECLNFAMMLCIYKTPYHYPYTLHAVCIVETQVMRCDPIHLLQRAYQRASNPTVFMVNSMKHAEVVLLICVKGYYFT
jgi:hypothetical protein